MKCPLFQLPLLLNPKHFNLPKIPIYISHCTYKSKRSPWYSIQIPLIRLSPSKNMVRGIEPSASVCTWPCRVARLSSKFTRAAIRRSIRCCRKLGNLELLSIFFHCNVTPSIEMHETVESALAFGSFATISNLCIKVFTNLRESEKERERVKQILIYLSFIDQISEVPRAPPNIFSLHSQFSFLLL